MDSNTDEVWRQWMTPAECFLYHELLLGILQLPELMINSINIVLNAGCYFNVIHGYIFNEKINLLD